MRFLEALPVALPVMPALGPLLLALLLLAILGAAIEVVALLNAVVSPIPWPVGPWFSSHLNDLHNWLASQAAAQLTHVIQAVIAVWSRIEWVNRVIVAAVAQGLDDVEWALDHTVNALLPKLQDFLHGLVDGVTTWASQEFDGLRRWVLEQLGPIPGLIQGAVAALWAQVVPYVNQVAGAVAAVDQVAINTLGGYTAAQTAAVLATAEAEIVNEAQRALRAEGATLATAQAYSAALQADLQARIFGPGGAVQGLEGDISKTGAATLATALAGAAALALPLEQAITDIRNLECIKACNPLGQLGNELASLDLAAVIALVAYAAADPKGAGRLVSSTLGPVIQDGAQLVRAVTGR